MNQIDKTGQRAGRWRDARPGRSLRSGEVVTERISVAASDEDRAHLVRNEAGAIDHVQNYRVHRIVRRETVPPPAGRLPPAVPQALRARPVLDTPPPAGLTAIDVEQLVMWALRQQKAHLDTATDDKRLLRGHNTWRDTAGFFELGTSVDKSVRYTAAATHPDADRVASRIAQLDPLYRRLVSEHARRATRPDLLVPERVRFLPFLGSNQRGPRRPAREYASWDKGHNWGWCPVYQDPGPADIDASRAIWRAWWYGLQQVAEGLRSDHATWQRHGMRWLRQWWPIDPAALPQPWGYAGG